MIPQAPFGLQPTRGISLLSVAEEAAPVAVLPPKQLLCHPASLPAPHLRFTPLPARARVAPALPAASLHEVWLMPLG